MSAKLEGFFPQQIGHRWFQSNESRISEKTFSAFVVNSERKKPLFSQSIKWLRFRSVVARLGSWWDSTGPAITVRSVVSLSLIPRGDSASDGPCCSAVLPSLESLKLMTSLTPREMAPPLPLFLAFSSLLLVLLLLFIFW